jgi:hypothetical protein
MSVSSLGQVLDVLACPRCGASLQWTSGNAEGDDGWLHCAPCAAVTPVLSGIAFFGETAFSPADPQTIAEALRARIGTHDDYARYAGVKHARNVLEPYAAFAPFNESTRAALPILHGARGYLEKNDLILDLSNRSGWTGACIAGLFPRQRVIAFWEGDSSVLGYRGFAYWFGAPTRPQNLFPIFLPPGSALPLKDAAARLVHGYDILHHRPLPQFLGDALRVAAKDAVLVFPHIHLANREPEPWFSRGGTHRHGRAYQEMLDRLVADGRSASVLSELSAFDAWQENIDGAAAFSSDPHTAHYNGIVMIAPTSVVQAAARSTRRAALFPSTVFVSNPFLRVNPITGRVSLLEGALSDHLRHMFDRHPAYEAFLLRAIEGLVLSPGDLSVLAAMEEGAALSQLGSMSGLDENEAARCAARLIAADLVVPAAVSKRVWHMQRDFHANGHRLIDGDGARILREWIEDAPGAPAFTLMGEPLTRAEIGEISTALLHWLARRRADARTLRVTAKEEKSTAWIALLAAAAGWNIDAEASTVFTLDEDRFSISANANTLSLAEIIEAYGGQDTEAMVAAALLGRLLRSEEALRIAAALA